MIQYIEWDFLKVLIFSLLSILILRPIVLRIRSFYYFDLSPNIDKNACYSYGLCTIRGRRDYMEDYSDVRSELQGKKDCTFYALFDGHGGKHAAEYCANKLCNNILEYLKEKSDTIEAIRKGFADTDEKYLREALDNNYDDGSTAIVALCLKKKLYIANLGDSRAVLIKKDGDVIPLSQDHKPNRPDEKERIEKAGGVVIFWGVWRVSGILAVSRAFGDRRLKTFVISEPDIMEWQIKSDDAYLVLATDGLWDAITSSVVLSSVVLNSNDARTACRKLTEMAYTAGSQDNISCMILDLRKHPEEKIKDL